MTFPSLVFFLSRLVYQLSSSDELAVWKTISSGFLHSIKRLQIILMKSSDFILLKQPEVCYIYIFLVAKDAKDVKGLKTVVEEQIELPDASEY